MTAMDARPPLLYLVHRIPYPPNKGDKVRSFNILRHLARRYRIYLGCFVDQAEDMDYVPRLGEWCAETHVVRLARRRARLAALAALVRGQALSVPYFADAGLRAWVAAVVARHDIRRGLVFSGPMAQYLDVAGLERRVIDFCDLDSAKWRQYADERRWPWSWLYAREADRLLAFERHAAQRTDASVFVTDAEADLLRRAAPELRERILAIENGVDSVFFSPERRHDDPYPRGGPVLLFTGAMDYWPNIDAVTWFARDILPAIRRAHADVRFYVVGRNPAAAVAELAGGHIRVTGTVPDIRPWLAHAGVVVAPLRVARGIQNKVLEAMAMGKPVVVSAGSASGLAGRAGDDFATAADAGEFVERVSALLANPESRARMGAAARRCVLARYAWDAHLERFERLLEERPAATAARVDAALEVQT
jgi:sugar transferase (PEP-CTERM/EpsH1 system associated)